MRLTSRLIASGVNGPPRSVANTKDESEAKLAQRAHLVAAKRMIARRHGDDVDLELHVDLTHVILLSKRADRASAGGERAEASGQK